MKTTTIYRIALVSSAFLMATAHLATAMQDKETLSSGGKLRTSADYLQQFQDFQESAKRMRQEIERRLTKLHPEGSKKQQKSAVKEDPHEREQEAERKRLAVEEEKLKRQFQEKYAQAEKLYGLNSRDLDYNWEMTNWSYLGKIQFLDELIKLEEKRNKAKALGANLSGLSGYYTQRWSEEDKINYLNQAIALQEKFNTAEKLGIIERYRLEAPNSMDLSKSKNDEKTEYFNKELKRLDRAIAIQEKYNAEKEKGIKGPETLLQEKYEKAKALGISEFDLKYSYDNKVVPERGEPYSDEQRNEYLDGLIAVQEKYNEAKDSGVDLLEYDNKFFFSNKDRINFLNEEIRKKESS